MDVKAIISADGRRRVILGAAALVVLVVLSYVPALRCGYIMDDERLLTANSNLQSAEGLRDTWIDPRASVDYYPLTYTTWWLENRLWGLDPLGYHLDNILLHAANVLLVWRILRRLGVPGAWLAAALFGVHPVQVESVAWVAERKSVLGGLACLLAVWFFVRSVMEAETLTPRRRRVYYGLSLLFFVCALLARPVTMAAAAVLPLLVWWKRGRLTGKEVLQSAAYFLVAAPMAALTIWIQYHQVGATGGVYDLSAVERLVLAGQALWFYAGKLAWPVPLIFGYPRWAIDAGEWWQYVYVAVAAGVVAATFLLRRQVGRGPLAAVLVFIVMLSPALGFVNVYWFQYYWVADHMQYLACIGLFAIAAAGAARGWARLKGWGRPAACAVPAAVVGVLAVLTWGQCGIYMDSITLWTDTIRQNPQSWMAEFNLGAYLGRERRFADAIPHYQSALAIKPDHKPSRVNLAAALTADGQTDEAIGQYREILKAEPESADMHNNLGNVLVKAKRFDEAMTEYQAAVRINRDLAQAQNNLGMMFAQRGRLDEAIACFREALRAKPDYAVAQANLRAALAERQRRGR